VGAAIHRDQFLDYGINGALGLGLLAFGDVVISLGNAAREPYVFETTPEGVRRYPASGRSRNLRETDPPPTLLFHIHMHTLRHQPWVPWSELRLSVHRSYGFNQLRIGAEKDSLLLVLIGRPGPLANQFKRSSTHVNLLDAVRIARWARLGGSEVKVATGAERMMTPYERESEVPRTGI